LFVALLALPFVLVLTALLLLYLPPVQHQVRGALVGFVAGRTGTTVELERLHLRFPLGVRLKGLYVADQQGDTLLHAGEISARVGLRALLRKRILLDPVELRDVRTHIHQGPDSVFNFDFIVAAFTGEDTTAAPADESGGMEFAIGRVGLHGIHHTMHLGPAGMRMDVRLGEFTVRFDRFDPGTMAFHADEVRLRDARVHLRTTSRPPEPSTYPHLENPLAGLDVRFRRMDLAQAAFTMATVDTGDSLWLAVDKALLLADGIDTERQRFALDELALSGMHFGSLTTAVAIAPDTIVGPPPWLGRDDGFRFWTQDRDLAIARLRVADSGIALHSDRIAGPARLFDPAHLVLTDIAVDARNVAVNNARIAMELDRLQAHGGPDAVAVQVRGVVGAEPAALAITNGRVQAMGNAVDLEVHARPGDLSTAWRAPDDVPVQVDLRTDLRMDRLMPLLAQVGTALPATLAADETWATRLRLAGTMRQVDTLRLLLAGDQGSRVHLHGHVHDLAQWPRNDMHLVLEELTMGAGMRQVVRAFVPAEQTLPGRLHARADVRSDGGAWRTRFDVDSDLGTVNGHAMVARWSGAMPDDVDLDITTRRVQVAALTGDTAFAPVDLHIVASGERLNTDRRNGLLTVTPRVLTINGNDLSSLRLSARATDDSVHVTVGAEADPAHLSLTADGRWPHAGDSIGMRLHLRVDRLHLQELGLLDRPLNVQGRWHGTFAATRDGAGRLRIDGDSVALSNGTRNFPFAHFALAGLVNADSTAVELDTDAVTFNYHSTFGVDSLMPRVQAKVQSFFRPDDAFVPVPGRRMEMAITLPRTDWLTELVLPELEAIELERFAGSYDSDTDRMRLDVDLPVLTYAGVDVRGLRVGMQAEGDRLDGRVALDRVERDSIHLENVALAVATGDRGSQLLLTAMEGAREEYRIGATVQRQDGVPVVRMDETFVLHFKPWTAHPDNALYLAPEGLRAEHFELSSGAQRMALRTGQRRNHIEFDRFDLANITEIVGARDSVPLVAGTLHGTVSLPFVEQGRLEAGLTIDALHARGVELGDLHLRASEREADRYTAELRLAHERNRLEASADARFGGKAPMIAADAELDFGDLSFLKPFVSAHLFALEGGMDGALRYRQHGDESRATGELVFHDAGIGVMLTGATYRLPDERIVLDEQGLRLDQVTLLDSAGNRFRLDGRVRMDVPGPPALDLRLRTERFQLVGSTIEQNDMFFGDLFARMDLRIGGTATSPEVAGRLGILEGTALSVVLPGSRVELIEHEGIVEFVERNGADTLALRTDSEVLRDSIAARLPGVALDLRVALDKRARFAVVLDPTTGDQATFSGEADLEFRYAPNGEIFLKGPFTVAEGGYTLEFYGLVKKRFDLVPGGTVTWDGDPLGGRMDVQARYRSETAPYPLVANAGGGISESERNRLQARLPFEVLIHVRETVNAPEIGFGLDLDRLSRNSFPQVSARLDQLAQPANEEELNRQVFGLLVLNSFIQDEENGGAPSGHLATTAARNSVNALLTEQLNRVTGQVVKGMDIQLGVNTYDQTAGGETYQRTAVDYKVSQRILNDRITIEAGGSLGVDERDHGVSNVSSTRAAQYAVTYALTEDGRLRLRVFHENAFDLYDGEIINNGVAIMLTRDFEENARDRERKREEARARAKADEAEEE
jgi:hypothetical protein